MTTLDEGRPVVSNMFDLIDTFIDQRKEAFINKLEYKLDNNSRKLEQRSGVASVLSDLDKTENQKVQKKLEITLCNILESTKLKLIMF